MSLIYNSLGQRTAIVNPLGQRLSFTYNANGLVQTIQDPLGAVTTILRDQVNRLTTRIDAMGNHYTFTYDLNSRLIQIANPLGGYRHADVRPGRPADRGDELDRPDDFIRV